MRQNEAWEEALKLASEGCAGDLRFAGSFVSRFGGQEDEHNVFFFGSFVGFCE